MKVIGTPIGRIKSHAGMLITNKISSNMINMLRPSLCTFIGEYRYIIAQRYVLIIFYANFYGCFVLLLN